MKLEDGGLAFGEEHRDIWEDTPENNRRERFEDYNFGELGYFSDTKGYVSETLGTLPGHFRDREDAYYEAKECGQFRPKYDPVTKNVRRYIYGDDIHFKLTDIRRAKSIYEDEKLRASKADDREI